MSGTDAGKLLNAAVDALGEKGSRELVAGLAEAATTVFPMGVGAFIAAISNATASVSNIPNKPATKSAQQTSIC